MVGTSSPDTPILWSFADDTSAGATTHPKRYHWWDRTDIIWDVSWHDLLPYSWELPTITRRRISNRGDGVLHLEDRKLFSPVDLGDKRLYSTIAVRVMAILTEFGMATTEQVVQMCGLNVIAQRVSSALNNLWESGALLRLQVPTTKGGHSYVWMPNRRKDSTRLPQWFSGADPWQYQMVSGGLDPMDSHGYSVSKDSIRHNLATMDVMLRALEVCPNVVGAWGERHGRAEQFSDQREFPTEAVRANIGDGVLVTKSGGIIILETTGAAHGSSVEAGNQAAEKAGAWVGVCGRSDLDVKVVFLDVAEKPTTKTLYKAVSLGVKKLSSKYVARSSVIERGKKRIFVADSRTWFPLPGTISTTFADMSCINIGTNRMEPVVDDESVDLAHPAVGTSVLSLHNPPWASNKASFDNVTWPPLS